MRRDVVALGELLIDFAPLGTDAGGYPALQAQPGGAPGNYLAALQRYGQRTALLGKVGDDAFGQLLRQTLSDLGVDVGGVVMDGSVFTTLAFVTLDGAGERQFSFARKPGADTRLRPEELCLSLLEGAKIFHFGSLSLTDEPARSATRQALAAARQAGLLISYDPNLRLPLWRDEAAAREQILWGLEQAELIKLSDEEAEFLWGCGPEAALNRILADGRARLALLSCGAGGAYLANAAHRVFAPCPPVCPVDTTGAGDICFGSATARLLRLGKAPETLSEAELLEIARFAVTAASLSTRRPGGMSSVPTEAEVLGMLAERLSPR